MHGTYENNIFIALHKQNDIAQIVFTIHFLIHYSVAVTCLPHAVHSHSRCLLAGMGICDNHVISSLPKLVGKVKGLNLCAGVHCTFFSMDTYL